MTTWFGVLPFSMRWRRVESVKATGLIGHAGLQIMTKTGARVGEVLQIRLTREHLMRAELPGGKEVIAFRAIPKGRDAEEPFYIDGRCFKARRAPSWPGRPARKPTWPLRSSMLHGGGLWPCKVG